MPFTGPVAGFCMNSPKQYLSDAAARLAKLDAQAARIRLSLLKICVYVTVSDGRIRRRALDAGIAAGVMNLPAEKFEDEVQRVVEEVLNEAK